MTPQQASDSVDATTNTMNTTTPTIDTDFDVSSLFEAGLKKGTHRVLARIIACEPYRTMEGAVAGWQFAIITLVALPDANGGQIEPGKRFSYLKVYTTPGQFDKDASAASKKVVRTLLGLNNIAVNATDKASVEAAKVAFAALPPERRLPTATDENTRHYEQWNDTVIVAVLKCDLKDGEPTTKLVGIDAASTAAS